MQEPLPKDFRLSRATLAAAGRIRTILVILAIAWTVIGMAVGSQLVTHAWLVVFALPPWGTFAFYYVAKGFARLLIPTFGRAIAYEAAAERYRTWWIRTQSDFRRSLPGRSFEIELAHLYARMGFEA
jgi:hypothetical protein